MNVKFKKSFFKMNKIWCFTVVTLIAFQSFAQIKFEKGYYIHDNGDRIECLIKNIDWRDNPTEFKFKLNDNAEVESKNIEEVKEFGIYEESRFIKAKVEIDHSSKERIDQMSKNKDPEFSSETLFLRVLVSGKANLYEYGQSDSKKYFFSVDEKEIKQLIYKKYLIEGPKIAYNLSYRSQLWENLKCSDYGINEVKDIKYTKRDLSKLFIAYNECNNDLIVDYGKIQKRDLFNLTIRPGITLSSLSVANDISDARDADFGSSISYRIGIESEFILPFNKNKWSIVIEPTFQKFSSEKQLDQRLAEVDYKSIEVPLGVRHYLYLNDHSKIFVNAFYIWDISFDSYIYYNSFPSLEIYSGGNFAVGLGYNFKNKYSIEIRYQSNRELLTDYTAWKSEFQSLSLNLGYSIF